MTKTGGKKFPVLTLFVSFLLVIVIAGFVSWQSGYLTIGTTPPVVINNSLNKTITPEISPKVVSPLALEISSTQTSVTATVTPAPVKKQIFLPNTERIIKLRLHGSNTVGENLAPALLEAYLGQQSVTQMRWVQGDVAVERELQYVQGDQVYAIELHAHGSSTGFKDLLNKKTDMSMSSRKIKAAEVEQLRPLMGDISSANQEYIIGLDGLAIIVNQNNSISRITNESLAKVFSGEISNWKQLGGADLAINLYARDENSGTWDTFNSLVLKANKKLLNTNSLRFESSSELSAQVAKDVAGIGFIGLPYVNSSKALAISETKESAIIYPTRFTVSTEDYALSRRLYMYAPHSGNPMAQAFSQFVVSESGQNVVEQVGLVHKISNLKILIL